MENNLFFSWSGSYSNLIAGVFYEYTPYILQETDIFYSPEGISKDEGWFEKIKHELQTAKSGIVFLTTENRKAEWILFEAGSLYRGGGVCILLCDLGHADIETKSPLRNLNVSILSNKEDVLKMFRTIRTALNLRLKDHVLKDTFDYYWPFIEEKINKIKSQEIKPEKKPIIPKELIGEWELIGRMRNGRRFGEQVQIDENGQYNIMFAGKHEYYFHIKVVDFSGKEFYMQKIQLADGKPTDHVHAIEFLSFESPALIVGVDNMQNKLEYRKIK